MDLIVNNFELNDIVQLEALNLLCDEKLGEGSMRTVFRHAFDPKLVVKIAKSSDGVKANWEEFSTWESVEFTKLNSWFARVHSVGDYGTILIQEWIPNIPAGKYKIPSFFTDLKPENYGLVVGTKSSQVVCRDYGMHLLREIGMKLSLVNYNVT